MPTKEQLKELQSKSLEEKIQISTARIIEWYENWGGASVRLLLRWKRQHGIA